MAFLASLNHFSSPLMWSTLCCNLSICASPVVHSADVELVLGCWLMDHELSLQGGLEPGLDCSPTLCLPIGQTRN